MVPKDTLVVNMRLRTSFRTVPILRLQHVRMLAISSLDMRQRQQPSSPLSPMPLEWRLRRSQVRGPLV